MLTKDSIQVRLKALLQNPDKMAVMGDARVINENGQVIMESAIEDCWNGNKENYKTDERLKYMVVYEWSVPGPVLMVNKNIYNLIGYYPENSSIDDLDFYLRAIGRDLVFFTDHIVAYYRILNTSLCRNKNNRKINITSIIKSYWKNMYLYQPKYRFKILKLIFYYFLELFPFFNKLFLIILLPYKILIKILRIHKKIISIIF
jgi:hypothetical protein